MAPSLHMNQGEGEASYARNSTFQNAEQNRMRPVIEEAISRLLPLLSSRSTTKSHSTVAIADLGCASGPNALALVSCAVDAIFQHYARQEQEKVPLELSVFLNDLPDNDFNDVTKRLVGFQQEGNRSISSPVTVGIVPGSFHKRLFPRSSLHLIFSSNSVHWLSEAPEDLRTRGIPMYDGDDCLRQARQPLVLEAYARQFKKDFKLFLNLRSQELVPGGQMVISLSGRRAGDDCTCQSSSRTPCDILLFILNDMATRGVISREKLDSFYIPFHSPSEKELKEIIEEEGTFEINNKKMLVHGAMSGGMDQNSITPKMLALTVRAIFEPLIVQHFGKSDQIMEEITRTMERHRSLGSPGVSITNIVFICVSLTKKM